jgi:hypothetical protein
LRWECPQFSLLDNYVRECALALIAAPCGAAKCFT